MAYPLRLLSTPAANAAFNMGLDQAILEAVAVGAAPPTLRFYQWSPPAISIGYFQGLHEEVDSDACRAYGVDVVRRITGGGAVFHQNELTYSLVLPESHPLAGGGLSDSYRRLCAGLVAGLARLGLEARFVPINDILIDNKKISGNAQTRKRACLLQHGTIIIDLDADLMFQLLRVPAEKMKGKFIGDIKQRVTSLSECLGAVPERKRVETAMAYGFEEALELVFEKASPSQAELERAQAGALEQFDNPDWTARK